MYNIAFVNHTDELAESKYIEELKKNRCSVQYIDSADLDERIQKMDAVIIMESSLEEIGQTCESIIKVRSMTNRFVWVMSKQSNKINRIIYLQLGSDGIFDKQTDSDEFGLYVVSTLERRSDANQLPGDQRSIESLDSEREEIRLIPSNFSVVINGSNEINLTKLEFRALQYLYEQRGRAIPYEDLYKKVWGTEKGEKRYRVSNLIFHIRKKMESASSDHEFIKTVRSKGYMLSV